jgi:hypothetical protein
MELLDVPPKMEKKIKHSVERNFLRKKPTIINSSK